MMRLASQHKDIVEISAERKELIEGYKKTLDEYQRANKGLEKSLDSKQKLLNNFLFEE